MALSDTQKVSLLFKTFFGKSEVDTNKPYYEEPKVGRPIVFGSQIWSDVDDIPATAPTNPTDGQEYGGVIKYFDTATFTAIPGIDNGYFLADLVDAIPASFGDGTYAPKLYKNDGNTPIFNGQNDWVLNEAAGTLYFYGGNPTGVSDSQLPKISFYKYIGTKGGGGSSSITVSNTPPSNPSNGSLWYNTVYGELLVYYTDNDSSQWVSSSNGSGGLWNYNLQDTVIENSFGSGLSVNGTVSGELRSAGTSPETTTSNGVPGDIRYDSEYIYICVDTDTWKRALLSSW